MRRWVALAAATAMLAVVAGVAASAPATPSASPRPAAAASDPLTGVYAGPGRVQRVREFARWVSPDHRLDLAADFAAGDDWTGIEMASGFPSRAWRGSGYRMVYGIPLLPATLDGQRLTAADNGPALLRGAAGEFTPHFTRLATQLVRQGQGDAVLRLGWEFNSDFFPWSVGAGEAAHSPTQKSLAFAAYWRHVVVAMRAVPDARFTFDWNPLLQDERSPAPDPTLAWPGADVVDVVGLDVYDNVPSDRARWGPERRWRYLLEASTGSGDRGYGLQWQAEHAAAHGKPLSFPEWGLTVRPDGSSSGGGDNPYFVRSLAAWMAEHDVLYEVYFNDDSSAGLHCLTCGSRFPRAARLYRELRAPDR